MNAQDAHPHNLSHQEKWLAAVRYLRGRFGSFPCQRPIYPSALSSEYTLAVPVTEEKPRFADRVRPIFRVK